jgi:hypothetical protein
LIPVAGRCERIPPSEINQPGRLTSAEDDELERLGFSGGAYDLVIRGKRAPPSLALAIWWKQ